MVVKKICVCIYIYVCIYTHAHTHICYKQRQYENDNITSNSQEKDRFKTTCNQIFLKIDKAVTTANHGYIKRHKEPIEETTKI